jgi:GT2 family glycosyltransferase
MSDLRAQMRHPELHQKQPEHITIAWCHPGHVNGAFMESVINLLWADANRKLGDQRILREGIRYISMKSGPRIGHARNECVRGFLKNPKSEWLWMLDTDMKFEPDTLDKLLDIADPDQRPVVGALCFGGGNGTPFPTMYRLVDPAENGGNVIECMLEWQPGSIVQVDATGAACLLIHRSVLEKMAAQFPEPAPWFAEMVYKRYEFGEDWGFCMRLGVLGIPLFVHTGASIGHMKEVEVNEQMFAGIHAAMSAELTAEEELTVVENKLVVVGAQ